MVTEISVKMPTVQVALIGILSLFITSGSGSKCPEEEISRLVVCYYKSETPLGNLNICSCTHLVFESATRRTDNYSLEITEDAKKDLSAAKEKKENLQTLFTLVTKPENSSAVLKSENKTWDQIQEIANLLQESGFDGVELNLQFNSQDGVSKDSYASFVKDLSKTLSNRHRRVKREGYDVSEKVQDDVTTAAYSTQSPKKTTSETPSLKSKSSRQGNRKTRENKGKSLEEDAEDMVLAEEGKTRDPEDGKGESAGKFLVFVRLSVKPEIIAKKFDLKTLSRYADILTVPTHDIANENENRVTYHPSRLMGLSDILNTDSILDFLTGMGAVKSKIVISLPASVRKFHLKDEHKNTPGSPSSSDPQTIDQSQLCSMFSKNNWTLERDEDLSAPYAFSGKTWLAFEDEISVNIKGKYILLRELGGGAIYPIDADVNDESCKNRTGSGGHLTTTLYNNFRNLGRKPRAAVLESLQEQIHGIGFSGIEAGVKLSEYRIVRVVDNSGAVHVIRKNTKTQFECSRQGYFSHPLGCNKFYRCVKFDQYSDEFTVFEYDCPAGLAFDERWEVCVWPGSLPHGAPCTGSSEIAPVPRSHYQCPSREGYYADPENCRWFFACLDHARDGVTPLTAYEFRCPFGLVFSEQKLACDWPWLVGGCGNAGAAGLVVGTSGGSSSATHTLTFVNGGNLEASFGQYGGNLQEEAAFGNFGKGFGSVLKETSGSYLGAQTAGFGYIAGQRDDNNNRASFASLPDYEISGGRIFNKGGLVLNQNVNTIGTSNGKIGIGVNEQFTGGERYQGRSGGFAAQNIQIHEASPTASGVQTSGDLSGHVSTIYHPLSTPKPFAVDIPSVQINEEGISDYSHHSAVSSTTPRVTQGFSTTLSPAPSSTPKPSVLHTVTESGFSFGSSPKVQVHRFDHPNSFAGGVTVSQAVSSGVPVVSGAQSFQHASGGLGTRVVNEHVSFGSSQPGIHGIELGRGGGLGVGQSGNSFAGFTGEGKQSVGISSVTPTTLIFGRTEQSTVSGGATAGSFVVPTKPAIQTVDFTPSGGLGVSQSVGNSYVEFTEQGKQSVGVSSVTPATLSFGRKEQSAISGGQPIVPFAVTSKPGIHTVEFTPSGGFGVSQSVGNSYVGFTGEGKQSVGVSSVTPATLIFGRNEQSRVSGGATAGPFVVPTKPAIQTVDFTSGRGLGVSQQAGNSFLGFTGEGKQSVGISSVTPATLNFGRKEQSVISGGQPIAPFSVTSKPGIHTVEFTPSGGFGVSQSVENSYVEFTEEGKQSVGISSVTPTTLIFERNEQNAISREQPAASFGVTSKPGIHTVEFTPSGGLGARHSVGNSYVGFAGEGKQSVGISSVTPATRNFGRKEQSVISGGQPIVPFAVTSKPGIHTVQFTSSRGSAASQPAGNTFVSFHDQGHESGISVGTPRPSGQPVSVHPTSQSSVYSFQSTGSGVSFSPTVAAKPAISTFEQTSIDQEVYRELHQNKPLNSYGVPVVTPKTGIFSYESTRSGYSGSVPASQPVASIPTPRTEIHDFSHGGAGQKLFSAVTPVSKVSFEGPGVTPTTPRTDTLNYNVGQSVRVAVPTQTVEYVTPKTVNTFVHGSGQSFEGAITENPVFGRKSSFRYGGDASSFGFSVPKSEIHQPAVQPSSGSPFSYSGDFNQLGSIKPLGGQSPKAEFFDKHEADVPSNVVTHVSVKQQPIVSVNTVSSINYDRGVSTGKPFASTAFTPSPPLTNFHSTYLQPEQPAPSPAPTASKNLFYQSSVQPLEVNTFSKGSQSVTYKQQQVHAQPTQTKIVSPAPGIQGAFVNRPQTVTFDQKVINFDEKVKSFPPSISRTFSSGQEINTAKPAFLDQSDAYLAPVTPGVFVTQTPQAVPVTPSSISFGNSFEVTGKEKLLHEEQVPPGGNGNFGFVRTETVGPQRVDHVEVSTARPELRKRPTSKPFLAQEQLLEFSKSVEVNPGQFFESTKTYFPPSPPTPLVIQQQPVRLISQKTFKQKEVVVPYYEQESFDNGERIGHVQINAIPEGGFEGQNAFQQGVGQIKTTGTNGIVYEQKQLFQPPVTPKTVYVPSADTPKPYAFPSVTPKVYASPAATPRTYLQSAVTEEIYKSSGSSENYVLPELTSKAYGIPEAHAPSGVTSKSYFSSAVTPKTFLQQTVTEEAYGPSAEPPRAYLLPEATPKTHARPVVTPKAPLSPSSVYSQRIENVTPVISGVFPAQKEVVLTRTKTVDYLPPAGVSVTPNVLVPSTTQAPHDFLSPLTEEISIQQHNNFEFQKVRGGEVNFIPSTTKPSPSFAPSGHFGFNQAHNFTSGHSIFGSGTGYSINPKIEIPEPPEEYFLAQDVYTRRPSSARVSKFKPSKSEGAYLPPEVTTPKATLISVGAVDDHGDNIQQLLNKYPGDFERVISQESFGSKLVKGDGKGEIEFGREGSSTVRYEVSSSRQRGRGRQYHGILTSSALPATNKYEEYEIEKENQRSLGKDGESSKTTLDLNIGLNKLDKNKKTVIVVSQVSDANPILVGKLAGQCSCQSNMLELRSKSKNPNRRRNQNQRQVGYSAEGDAQSGSEETVLIGGGQGVSYETEQSVISSTTAAYPGSPSILSSLGTDGVLPITPESLFREARLKNKKKHFRGTTRYLPVPSDFGGKFSGEGFLLSPVPASEIASTVDYGVLEGGESRAQNEIDGGRGKAAAGAAFDRYGPGGWRGYDETLQGSVDCKRPGLFRHPKHCNKFYACNYDPWKERYTLHVFNCPIQLTYDSSISACNWPIRGPACADDNLLV